MLSDYTPLPPIPYTGPLRQPPLPLQAPQGHPGSPGRNDHRTMGPGPYQTTYLTRSLHYYDKIE